MRRVSQAGMNVRRRVQQAAYVLVVCAAVMWPSTARAEGELTGVIGGLLGGDLNGVIGNNINIKSVFDNGPLYGVRLGWVAPFVGFEGSFVYSPNGVSLSLPSVDLDLDGKVYYLEGNFLFLPIPGPISPFATAGVGLHSYNLNVDLPGVSSQVADLQKLGYNFGGGVKINIKGMTIRGEVRDHMTSVEPDDFNLGLIAPDLFDKQWLHNVEISAGIGIRF